MSWLIDQASAIYILLVIIATGFVVVWGFNKRVKFLGYAAGILALLALFWLLTRFVETDSTRLKKSVHAMADAVVSGKVDDLFKHISKDFDYHGMTRDLLYIAARKAIEGNRVRNIHVSKFNVEEASRGTGRARASFNISGSGADFSFFYRVETDFILEGDEWKLKTMRFYNPAVNQNQEIRLPGI